MHKLNRNFVASSCKCWFQNYQDFLL